MIDYSISTDKSKLDIHVIHDFIANRSYWAKGRSYATIMRSIENSLCFGMYNSTGNLIGFARVITDYSVFAYILDVFILEDFRGKGLSLKLMDHIMQHPDLQGLHRIMLATKDAHSLYEKFGFRLTQSADKLMEKVI